MRDSDVAIGALVLLGIVGALIYFLFPMFISGVLRGPSYATIIKNQQNETAAFDRETEIILSYLQDSWTMNAFRRLDAVFRPGGYEDWVQKVKLERNTMARDAVAYIAQNPARRSEYAIATFERSVYLSPDSGRTWKKIAERGTAE